MAKQAIPVTIRGITYPSRGAAARALGVTRGAIFAANKFGWLDHVGLGRGRPRPVTIGGQEYPNARVAAKALSLSATQVYGYLAVQRTIAQRKETPNE
jgi:hypothetical protein